MPAGWLLAVYRTPTSPSTARVAAWRGLHALGGLFIAPTACILPPAIADTRQLEAIALRVRSAGGSFEVLEVEAFAEATELTLRGRYSEARDAEYAEVVEQAEAMVDELDREGSRNKFTYAEVEENEADLAKLQRWLRRVRTRDIFASSGRAAAVAAVERAAARLEAFVGDAIAQEQDLADANADIHPRRRRR
jgi:hypothetical protein